LKPLQSFTRVGIAMAVYRPDVTFFAEQLESLVAQTHQDWFCVMTFDSPAAEVVNHPRISAALKDQRFTWLENSRRLGHKKNFQLAIAECVRRGADAIACADQDDIWYPHKVARSLAALDRSGPLSLVHCNMHVLVMQDGGARLSPATAWEFDRRGVAHCRPEHLIVRNVVGGASMLMDAQIAARHPSIPDAFPYHDWWYAAVASTYRPISAIYEPLYRYRQHGSNVAGLIQRPGLLGALSDHRHVLDMKRHRHDWGATRQRARALAAERPPDRRRRWLFDSFDFGAALAMTGLASLASDQLLGRTCIVNALGKCHALAFLDEEPAAHQAGLR